MIIPLQPKSKSRNPRTLKLRLDMYERRWIPVACEAKANMHQAWASVLVTRDLIMEWDRPGSPYRELAGTGVRLEGDIFVVDLDITDPILYAKIISRLRERFPDWFAGALERTSGGVKRAFFGRISKPFKQRRTRRYTAELALLAQLSQDLTPEQRRAIKATLKAQLVETFGGDSNGRYFAWHGPHSTPGREYGPVDPDRAPWNTSLDSLPIFDADEVGELIDLCEACMASSMLVPIPENTAAASGVFWDLEPDGTFITKDGEEIRHDDLEAMLPQGAENGIRGCRDWSAWSMSDSKSHCNAFLGPSGKLVIHNFQDDSTHHWAADRPRPAYEMPAAVRERLKAMSDPRPPEPAPDDEPVDDEPVDDEPDDPRQAADADDGIPVGTPRETIVRDDIDGTVGYANAVNWLLHNVAFMVHAFGGRGGAISIFHDGEFQTAVTLPALRAALMSYVWLEEGPRGGIRRHHPVDMWQASPDQIQVKGVRVRPDMTRPLFIDPDDDDNLLCINRYTPPNHPTEGGVVEPFLARLGALIPDEIEREWFLNWLAAKVQHPEWRMVGVAMIARETGTGRGLLAETLTKLFGTRFVTPLPYAKLSGGSGSRFNAEVAEVLIAYINESREADDRKFSHKNASREALKDFVEPNHALPFRVEPKGQDAYTTRASVSTIVFTNNIDGLPLSDSDRRIAVVMNGDQMLPEAVRKYRAWLADAANIGALHRWLKAYAVESDTEIFDPYMAPEFYGRDLMVDAGKTGIDRAWDDAIERMQTAADLYTTKQVIAVCRQLARPHGTDFDELIEKHTISSGYRVGIKNSKLWHVTFNGEKVKVYAFNERDRKRYTAGGQTEVLRQLGMLQQLVDEPGKKFNKNLKGLVGG